MKVHTMDDTEREAVAVSSDLALAGLSVIPVVGGPLVGILTAGQNVRNRRALRTLERTVAQHGISIERIEAAMGDEHAGAVVEHALRVATGARSDEKRDLLASVIADAALNPGNETRCERDHLLLNLIEQLERVHVDILRLIGEPHSVPHLLGLNANTGLTSRAIAFVRPDLADVVAPALATLTALGLVTNADGIGFSGDAPVLLKVTDAGVWVLQSLRARAAAR
jgi:hypothetical protein